MVRLSVFAMVCVLGAGVAPDARAQESIPVPQGWSAQDKTTWYTLSQGSRLLPLSWLRALEQPGPGAANAPKLVLDRVYIESFRYLPNDAPNAAGLPVGFAIDTQEDDDFDVTKLRWKSPQSNRESWVGFNCSACHTGEMTFGGKRMRVDGAPTLADFQGFMESLNRALVETRDDAGKFERFAKGVLTPASVNTAANRNRLMGELNKLIDWQRQVESANKTPLQYGFARLDAFGHIFNKVLLRVKADPPQFKNPSDAPVSYPFLWNIHQHDKVQWNGIAPNGPMVGKLDLGALGRNVGEVIGVFADIKILPVPVSVIGYPSSARVDNLDKLERQLTRLLPPVWPDALPPIETAKWQAGKTLFDQRCARCHTVLPRSDLKTPIVAEMTPLIGSERIGTDPWMACNAYTYQAQSGRLRGTPAKFFVFSSLPINDPDSVATMLGTTVVGSIWNEKDEVLQSLRDDSVKGLLQSAKPFDIKKGQKIFDSTDFIAKLFPEPQPTEKAARLKRCFEEASPTLAYKGRPLTGIWATPPYLHNGSVPTLFDLLLPPADRPPSFALGTREFDPEKVGYVTNESKFATDKTRAENTFVFNTRDANGAIAGNGNDGHDYGNASLTNDDRMALVEYMKAVGGRVASGKVVAD